PPPAGHTPELCSPGGNPQERIPAADPRLPRGTPLKAPASPQKLPLETARQAVIRCKGGRSRGRTPRLPEEPSRDGCCSYRPLEGVTEVGAAGGGVPRRAEVLGPRDALVRHDAQLPDAER